MGELFQILRRLLFSKIGCVNRVGDECRFLMNGRRCGRKCCFQQCKEVHKRLKGWGWER